MNIYILFAYLMASHVSPQTEVSRHESSSYGHCISLAPRAPHPNYRKAAQPHVIIVSSPVIEEVLELPAEPPKSLPGRCKVYETLPGGTAILSGICVRNVDFESGSYTNEDPPHYSSLCPVLGKSAVEPVSAIAGLTLSVDVCN